MTILEKRDAIINDPILKELERNLDLPGGEEAFDAYYIPLLLKYGIQPTKDESYSNSTND